MYVALDLHGAPGGQSTDRSRGVIGQNMYTDETNPAVARIQRGALQGLPDAAAYDLLNEPMNNSTDYPTGWTAGSSQTIECMTAFYNRIIKAIRQIDSRHVITVEGIGSIDCLPDPADYG